MYYNMYFMSLKHSGIFSLLCPIKKYDDKENITKYNHSIDSTSMYKIKSYFEQLLIVSIRTLLPTLVKIKF